ncbi:MAG TPA: molybdate ABC transporter substrate-binding protein [Planctomycetaceae bacterium]|nr:molybdate ABC transporter substrate-binding protein [Blastopirellula sp.]HAY81798.1 molybdate ABC transporter substrate-binding protein [Planctomycetaceae bacterium]
MVPRHGSSNSLYLFAIGSVALLIVLGLAMFGRWTKPNSNPSTADGTQDTSNATTSPDSDEALMMYCAAGMRYPVDEIVKQYEAEFGKKISLNYSGSNTLLSQLEVNQTGDLYLAADDSYITKGRDKGLLAEAIPVATQTPVIVVKRGNAKNIQSAADLLRDDVSVVLPDPDAAACGKKAKQLLSASGHWNALQQSARVYKPTVNETINAVKIDVDAGIVWDSTVAQYPDMEAIHCEELDQGRATIEIAVVKQTKHPTAALHFARYLASIDKGLEIFRAKGMQPVAGDRWSEHPELTLFAGAVNRKALEPIIKEFQEREGVTVNTKYNGCGILTAEMRSLQSNPVGSFPDTFMACDVYYMETVKDLFLESENVSATDIVMVVKKGNPKKIQTLKDLLRDDVRLVLGEPKQCTIGVLSKRLLQEEGIYDQLTRDKEINTKQTSAMLVPDVITGSADVVLAYVTDTQAEANKVDVVPIESPQAKAIQPFSIAKSSANKYLSERLFEKIAQSRDKFEAAGFQWRLQK